MPIGVFWRLEGAWAFVTKVDFGQLTEAEALNIGVKAILAQGTMNS